METISIYIHIPLCVKKCAYCDFASFAGRMAQRESYVKAVCCEMRTQAAFFGRRRVKTVFFGGGTPTLLTGAQVQEIMDTLRACFDLLPDAEITMEGNPGTVSLDSLRAAWTTICLPPWAAFIPRRRRRKPFFWRARRALTT